MKRVKTLQELRNLALERKSVICPKYHGYVKPRPAAWMINLSGGMLLNFFTSGLFVYEPKKKSKEAI